MVVSSWACSWYVRPSHWTKKVEWFLSCCAALTSCTLITLSRSMNLPWWTCSNIIIDHTCNITIQGRFSETLRYLSLHTIHVHVLAMDSMIIQHSIVGNFWRVQFLGVFADKDDLSTKIAPLEKFTFYIRQKKFNHHEIILPKQFHGLRRKPSQYHLLTRAHLWEAYKKGRASKISA